MSDYPKKYGTATYPVLNEKSSHLIERIEPILTPEKLASRFLKGLDLNSYSDDELKDHITIAMNETEIQLGVPLIPELKKQKFPFDRNLYRSFVHIMTDFRPIISLESFKIVGSDGLNIWEIPSSWIESSRFFQGQINVIALTVLQTSAAATGLGTNGAAGLSFLAAISGNVSWIPAYFQLEYITGVCSKAGSVPILVNQLVGINAALEILGNLGPQIKNISQSVNHDGLGQSSAGLGARHFNDRIQQLEAKRDKLVGQLRKVYYNKYFMSNI